MSAPASVDGSETKVAERPYVVLDEFKAQMDKRPEAAIQVVAILALLEVLQKSEEQTIQGMLKELRNAAEELGSCDASLLKGHTSWSVKAGCELLVRYITRTAKVGSMTSYSLIKSQLTKRGLTLADASLKSRAKVAELASTFIADGSLVMTHGYSGVCLQLFERAAKTADFTVIVTEGRPAGTGKAGEVMAAELAKRNIKCTLILDAAAAFHMSKVDMVVVGAQAVVESGGVVSKIGTYGLALIADVLKTPFYVAAEAYKFARIFPLAQEDVPDAVVADEWATVDGDKVEVDSRSVDYTPPQHITLLFTDLGVLTPSAVSDELIKLYS